MPAYVKKKQWSRLLLLVFFVASSQQRRSVVVMAWTTTPPSSASSFYRPIPPDAAQELEDYFSSGKAVMDLADLENLAGGIFPQAVVEAAAAATDKPSYKSLEERVRNLEVQLASLLKYGIPATEQEDINLVESSSLASTTVGTTQTVRTIQGIPYYYASEATPTDVGNAIAAAAATTTTTTTTSVKAQGWESQLQHELENGMHMRGGERIMASGRLENIVVEETTREMPVLTNDVADEQHNDASTLVFDVRQSNLQKEIQACQSLTRQVLKQELQARGIDTKPLFEKSDFVARLAEARVQEAEESMRKQQQQECMSTKIVNEVEVVREVEVVTDDDETWNYRQEHGFSQGIPTGGMHGFVQNGVVVNAGNGDSIPDMQNFGDGGGAFGGVNPFVLAKVRECLANPAAFAKYYSDPDLVAIIRELREQMP